MMEAIEKLRERIRLTVGNLMWKDGVAETADEIERELSERYMELPVDADGVPIHVGDEVKHLASGRKFNVGRIKIGKRSILVGGAPYDYTPNQCRHVKPDPIKELLEEFGENVARQGHQAGFVLDDMATHYAVKLREAMGGDV